MTERNIDWARNLLHEAKTLEASVLPSYDRALDLALFWAAEHGLKHEYQAAIGQLVCAIALAIDGSMHPHEWHEDWAVDEENQVERASSGAFEAEIHDGSMLNVCMDVDSTEHAKWLAEHFVRIANRHPPKFEGEKRERDSKDPT